MAERRSDRTGPERDEQIDLELLARIVARDRQALTALYDRYYHSLLRFMHRLTGDIESAQEGVNDVMLVVWQKANSFAGRSRPSTWIMGIAYRKAMRLQSRLHRWNFRFKAADWHEAIEPVARIEGLTEGLEQQELLFRAINSLKPKQRAVVELTYHFGYSYQEIAEILQCPENTVKTRMFHARATLRQVLQQLGHGSGDD